MKLRLQARHQAGVQKAKELADILKTDFGATKVVLFGSMLSASDIHMASDIDLAVWDLPAEKYFAALGRLLTSTRNFDIDLVRIEEAPPSLQSYLLKDGLVLDSALNLAPILNNMLEHEYPLSNHRRMASYSILVSRIRRILSELAAEYDYAQSQALLAQETQQDIYWTAVGLSLHSFYTGLEKAFEQIADKVDAGLDTKSEQWHKALLDQMALDVPGVRPPVIDESAYQYLEKYLSFRHVIRSHYTHRLEPVRIADNFYMMEDCYALITRQLNEFCDFLAAID